METIEQKKELPITKQQIEDFLWWRKIFSGDGKKVNIEPHNTETTFTSYEEDGKKYIKAKNVFVDVALI